MLQLTYLVSFYSMDKRRSECFGSVSTYSPLERIGGVGGAEEEEDKSNKTTQRTYAQSREKQGEL